MRSGRQTCEAAFRKTAKADTLCKDPPFVTTIEGLPGEEEPPQEGSDSIIPLYRPEISEEDVQTVASVLRAGQWNGAQTAQFERALADAVNTKHAIAVSSGT